MMASLDVEKHSRLDSSVMDASFNENDDLIRSENKTKDSNFSRKENPPDISVIDVKPCKDGDDHSIHSVQSRSNVQISSNLEADHNLILAATLVEDARVGRHSDFKMTDRHLKLYQLYQNTYGKIILTIIIICHLLLALFEEPASSDLLLSYWSTIPVEIAFLMCYIFRLIHIRMFCTSTRFWSDTKHIILISIITLTFIDMIIYIPLKENGLYGIRWSRVLRPLFAVNFPEMMQIRRAFRNLRRTLPDVANVLVLFFFSLGIFALMAYKLFGSRNLKWANGRSYFATYWDSIFDLYVLVSTSNNPDIMMPVFDISVGYVIFFVIFLIICFFIYMNIILAVIYNNYRTHLKNEVRKSILSKRQRLRQAFDLLSVPMHQIANECTTNAAFDSKRNRKIECITKKRFTELLSVLPRNFSTALSHVFWIVLDSDESNVIEKKEFMRLADLLNVEVSEIVDKRNCFGKRIPKIYYSKFSINLRSIITHRYFTVVFDLLTFANAVVIGVATEDAEWDDAVEWVFLSLFMIEIILKIYSYGGSFFKRMWNLFDFIVIGAAFLVGMIEQLKDNEEESRLTLDVLLVLRVLRLVRLIGNINRFKVIVMTINKIVPSLLTYGGVMLVFYYIFAIIGMEVFKDYIVYSGYDDQNSKLYCGNDNLKDTEFWRDKYCNNNFNDITHAFIVLFELTVVNQWHVIAYGYAAVTNGAAKLFFITFHLICVIVVLNIFTAFVLEVFILEYSASYSELESEVEKKIHELGLSNSLEKRRISNVSALNLVENYEDDESSDDSDVFDENNKANEGNRPISERTYVRFHLSKKVKSVEVLLQKLFEKELGVHDLDEDFDGADWVNRGSTAWHLGVN